jgi:hypothetical protein
MSKWMFLTLLIIGCDIAPDTFRGSTDGGWGADTDTDFDNDDTENPSDSAVNTDTDAEDTDTGANPVCTPNGMDNCPCPEGGSGVRICNSDGSGWLACLCSQVETDTDRCDDYRIYGGENTGESCTKDSADEYYCIKYGGTLFDAQNCIDDAPIQQSGKCCKQAPPCPAEQCMNNNLDAKFRCKQAGGSIQYPPIHSCDGDSFCCEEMGQ